MKNRPFQSHPSKTAKVIRRPKVFASSAPNALVDGIRRQNVFVHFSDWNGVQHKKSRTAQQNRWLGSLDAHKKKPRTFQSAKLGGTSSQRSPQFKSNLTYERRECSAETPSNAWRFGDDLAESSLENINGNQANTSSHEHEHEHEQSSDFSGKTSEMQSLEALLFLTREPLNARRLAQFLGETEPAEILNNIRKLNRFYDQSHCAFRILEFARGFQLRTRPQFTPWLRLLCHQGGVENQENPEIRLSPPAMETLAIIAYREAFDSPATRAEIEAVRGVQSCMEILKQLLGKDLIRIAGRSPELGRPRLYRTTKKFLEVFGLKSLTQLPRVDLS